MSRCVQKKNSFCICASIMTNRYIQHLTYSHLENCFCKKHDPQVIYSSRCTTDKATNHICGLLFMADKSHILDLIRWLSQSQINVDLPTGQEHCLELELGTLHMLYTIINTFYRNSNEHRYVKLQVPY